MNRHLHEIGVILAIGATLGTASKAIGQQVLFNSYVSDRFTVTYGLDGNDGFQAFLFSPTTTGALSDITVALGRTSTLQTTTVFQLYTAPSRAGFGALIETFVIPNDVTPDNTPPFTGAPVTFVSAVKPTLVAGRDYWLSFTEGDPANGASSLWFSNGVVNGVRLTNLLGPHENALPAFRLVAAVPEPQVPLLLITGLVVLALQRQRMHVATSALLPAT